MEKHGVMAFDDVAHDDRIRGLFKRVVKEDVKSIMYVGVSVGNELIGAFALSTTKELRHWSEADIEVAKAAADQTGIAIRQARLYQKAEATSMREALVNKLSVAIRASLSLASMLDTATRELTHALSASRVKIRLDNFDGAHSSSRSSLTEADSLYIDLADRPSADSREVAPGVVLDFDENGHLVGIDIDHASESKVELLAAVPNLAVNIVAH